MISIWACRRWWVNLNNKYSVSYEKEYGKKINGWGERMLSSAGNEVLIKAVLQAIPTYIMSYFLLYLVFSIETAIRAYWWGNGS